MARKVRHSRFESRTSRLKLVIKPKPYTGPALADGVTLLYRRRSQTNGTWVLKVGVGDGQNRTYWTKRIGLADDYDESDGEKILTYFQAQDKAKELTRSGDPKAGAFITVDGALAHYKVDLEARGANPFNADMPRYHLTPALLAKPVALLTSDELETWRNGLLDKVKPSSVNRIGNGLRAALERAARHDKRIQNQSAWKLGLGSLPEREGARDVYLPEDVVHALVQAAYARDAALGLLTETLAVTGGRPSQIVRLRAEDLRDHPTQPKLMMPRSGKGGGLNRAEKKHEHFSVPITVALAAKLKAVASDRSPDDPLLVRADGYPWSRDPSRDYRGIIREIVAGLGLDPSRITMYSLRHSSIARRLLKGAPLKLVASLHDTGIQPIEAHYARFIGEHADEVTARIGMLGEDLEPADNVVPIKAREC